MWQSLTTLAGVITRERRGRFSYRVRKKSHVKREAEIRAGAASWDMLRTASNHPELETGKDWFFPEASGGGTTHWQLHCGHWSLQNLWRINFCCWKWPRLQLFVMATLGNEYNTVHIRCIGPARIQWRDLTKLKILSASCFLWASYNILCCL